MSRKVIIQGNVLLITVRDNRGRARSIDFYLLFPDADRVYAFSRDYTANTYRFCRSGIPVNDLSCRRSRDRSVMNLVKYLNVMLPYLTEYYDLPKRHPWCIKKTRRT